MPNTSNNSNCNEIAQLLTSYLNEVVADPTINYPNISSLSYTIGLFEQNNAIEGHEMLNHIAANDITLQAKLFEYYWRKEDYESAVFWVKKGYEKGDMDATSIYGFCLWYGKGINEDKAEASRILIPLAQNNNAMAQYICGVACHEEYIKDLEDPSRTKEYSHPADNLLAALDWLKRASQNGHPLAKKAYLKISINSKEPL